MADADKTPARPLSVTSIAEKVLTAGITALVLGAGATIWNFYSTAEKREADNKAALVDMQTKLDSMQSVFVSQIAGLSTRISVLESNRTEIVSAIQTVSAIQSDSNEIPQTAAQTESKIPLLDIQQQQPAQHIIDQQQKVSDTLQDQLLKTYEQKTWNTKRQREK